MNREDELLQEVRALRERLSRLSEASLRINESLDYHTVLQGVLDSARTLTQARYGVIALLDDSGRPQDILWSGLSSGIAGHRWLEPPASSRIFDYFNGLQEPLRVPDLQGHLRAEGLPELNMPEGISPSVANLSAPVFHHGECLGHIFLADNERNAEFTQEDEDTLVMFAAQAALVIANANRYREEQRARNDLEALVSTSPVGVVVFDARTGAPVSFNHEAVRIMDFLGSPDQTPEYLLNVLTVRRASGEELFLGNVSLAHALSAGEAVRAEEVVLLVPDGRSFTALVNATPIRSETGEVETFVVTVQDMSPLEDLERLRAEFLATVSHELRTPLATVRGSMSALLDETTSMHPAAMRQFHNIVLEQTDRMLALVTDLLDIARIETGTLPVSPEPTDLAMMAGEAANAFRIGGRGHNLVVDIPPDLPWVMADRARIVQVLANLLTNAARHSPEASTINVVARPREMHVLVSVTDEGRGIPADSLPLLFRKFSRLESEDQGGDTGLGLAVCKGIVEAHGGRIWAESEGRGLGARFSFMLPTAEEGGFVSPSPRPDIRPSRRSSREQARILVVDDDPQALRYTRDAVVKAGYTAIATVNPDDVSRIIEEEKPSLVLLDLILPGVDGIDLMSEVINTEDVPVIFVSAYGQDQLVARAFEMGADDYVVKPFSPTELEARIAAALRRRTTTDPPVPYVSGDLVIDYAERLVTLRGSPVTLTAIEYRLLVELSANAGRVLTYEHLLRRVWGTDGDADVRPMRTAVSSIRRRLEDDAEDPTYIFTELRVGYRMPKADM